MLFGNWQAGQRIADRRPSHAREVAAPHRVGQHVRLRNGFARLAHTFVGRHEEGLVAAERTADDAAELVPIELGLGCRRRREEVARVHRVVADVVEGRPVERVAARLELQLHVRARVAAVLRRVVRRLDLEFLYGVNRWIHEQVVAAVVERAHTVKRDLLIHAARAARSELCSGGDDARGEVAERREVPARERHVHERCTADHVAGDAALRFEQQASRFYVDDLADISNLQHEGEPRHLRDANRDRRTFAAEARQRGLNCVVPRHQIPDLERAGRAADDRPGDARRQARDGDVGSRDDGAARIGDGAQNARVD